MKKEKKGKDILNNDRKHLDQLTGSNVRVNIFSVGSDYVKIYQT